MTALPTASSVRIAPVRIALTIWTMRSSASTPYGVAWSATPAPSSESLAVMHSSISYLIIVSQMYCRPKITAPNSGDMRLHNKGCNCKRSGCLKNYCECYEAKIPCSAMCKCVGTYRDQLEVISYKYSYNIRYLRLSKYGGSAGC